MRRGRKTRIFGQRRKRKGGSSSVSTIRIYSLGVSRRRTSG
jgi:hypothetical protein